MSRQPDEPLAHVRAGSAAEALGIVLARCTMIMPNSSDGRDIIRAFVTLINARLAREEITGTLVFFRATATTGEDSGTFLADSGWVAQLLAHALGSVSRLALNSEGRRLLPQIRPGCYYITFTRTCVKAGSVVLWGTETAATAV